MRSLFYSSLGILILMLFSTFIACASAQEVERQKPQPTEVVGNNASIAPPKLEMTPATASKMAVKVKLQAGEISVDAFTEALSKQTGLTITATPALRERKIVVQITDALASDLLTAIADMNDWTVREIKESQDAGTGDRPRSDKKTPEAKPGRLLILHRVLQVPQEAAFVPRLIQNALPRDLQDYLQVVRPSDNRHEYRNPNDAMMGSNDPKVSNERFMRQVRSRNTDIQSMQNFTAVLRVDSLLKEQLPYSKLTDNQKQMLLSFYIFDALRPIHLLLLGDLSPPLHDPGSYRIHFDEKSNNFQGPGFGAYIQPLTQK